MINFFTGVIGCGIFICLIKLVSLKKLLVEIN